MLLCNDNLQYNIMQFSTSKTKVDKFDSTLSPKPILVNNRSQIRNSAFVAGTKQPNWNFKFQLKFYSKQKYYNYLPSHQPEQ